MIIVRRSPLGLTMAVRHDKQPRFHETFGQVRGDDATGATGLWEPPVDIYEIDDALIMQVELPGVPQEAVCVEVHEHTLRLSGKRTRQPPILGGRYQREEGCYGAFRRAFRIPTIVDEARIQATYQDGVLTLRLPKHATATPQGMPITG